MQVQEIMTRNVYTVDPEMTIRDAARRMRTDNIGALPVGENDRLIGMVTDRDIVTRAIAEDAPGTTKIRDVMSRLVRYCFDDDDVHQATKVMVEYQVRRLPVLNREKRLVGIVALADLGRSEETTAAHGALRGVSQPAAKERR